jgi:hypothetical protein
MSRPAYSVPNPRVVFVKDETQCDAYDAYLLLPVKLGGIVSLAWMNYGTDDGQSGFSKLDAAVRHLLSVRGYEELAKRSDLSFSGQTSGSKRKSKKLAPIAGSVLLERGVWYEFCKSRNIAQGDMKALQTRYDVTAAERKQWGLPGGDED